MKICDVVINTVWYDPRVRKQIDSYLADGCEVSVVGFNDIKRNEDEIAKIGTHVDIVDMDRKYYRENRTFFTKIKRELLSLKRLKRAIADTKPQIIHANDLNAFVPAYYAAKKTGAKLIYDTHEIFLENNMVMNSRFNRFYWGVWEKHLIRKADLVVCVSHAAEEYLTKKYKLKRTMVVTNCSKSSIKESDLHAKGEKFQILNHGQFYAGRGYDTMLSAASLTENTDIEYVMRGYGNMEESLRQTALEKSLENVRFAPPVKVYELIPFAAESAVGVAITEPICLNFKLSVSNKLFEYASARLPVIMSDIPEHRYLNEKYEFGIIISENTGKALHDAVQKLYSDREFYARCAENARKMSQSVTWEEDFGRLLSAEKKMIGEEK